MHHIFFLAQFHDRFSSVLKKSTEKVFNFALKNLSESRNVFVFHTLKRHYMHKFLIISLSIAYPEMFNKVFSLFNSS